MAICTNKYITLINDQTPEPLMFQRLNLLLNELVALAKKTIDSDAFFSQVTCMSLGVTPTLLLSPHSLQTLSILNEHNLLELYYDDLLPELLPIPQVLNAHFKQLTHYQINAIVPTIKEQLVPFLNSPKDLNLTLQWLSPYQRVEIYNSEQSQKVVSNLSDAASLHSVLEHLSIGSRAEVYRTFKNNRGLNSALICKPAEFNQILCFLEQIYRDEVYQQFKQDNHFERINSASDLKLVLEFLNPKQRDEVYGYLREHKATASFVTSFYDFTVIAPYLSPAQRAELYSNTKERITIKSIQELIDTAPYCSIDEFHSHCLILSQSTTYQQEQYDVLNIFHDLNPHYCSVAYDVFALEQQPHNARSWGLILGRVEQTTKDTIFSNLKDKLINIIHNAKDFHALMQPLAPEQREQLYTTIKTTYFLSDIVDIKDFALVFEFLTSEQRLEVYDNIITKFTIENAAEFNQYLKFLSPDLRGIIYEEWQKENNILPLITTIEELGLIAEFVESKQVDILIQQLKDNNKLSLQDLDTLDLESLAIQLSGLNPGTLAQIFPFVKERFIEHPYKNYELGCILSHFDRHGINLILDEFSKALKPIDYLTIEAYLNEKNSLLATKRAIPSEVFDPKQLIELFNPQQCALIFKNLPNYYRLYDLLNLATPAQYQAIYDLNHQKIGASLNYITKSLENPYLTDTMRQSLVSQLHSNHMTLIQSGNDLERILKLLMLNERTALWPVIKERTGPLIKPKKFTDLLQLLVHFPKDLWSEICGQFENQQVFFSNVKTPRLPWAPLSLLPPVTDFDSIDPLTETLNQHERSIICTALNKQFYKFALKLIEKETQIDVNKLNDIRYLFREHLSITQTIVHDLSFVHSIIQSIDRIKKPNTNLPLYLKNTYSFFSPYRSLHEVGTQYSKLLMIALMHILSTLRILGVLLDTPLFIVVTPFIKIIFWAINWLTEDSYKDLQEALPSTSDYLVRFFYLSVYALALQGQLLIQLPLVIASIFTRSVTTVFTVFAELLPGSPIVTDDLGDEHVLITP